MKGVFKRGDITVWLRKSFDFVHGYGYTSILNDRANQINIQ